MHDSLLSCRTCYQDGKIRDLSFILPKLVYLLRYRSITHKMEPFSKPRMTRNRWPGKSSRGCFMQYYSLQAARRSWALWTCLEACSRYQWADPWCEGTCLVSASGLVGLI